MTPAEFILSRLQRLKTDETMHRDDIRHTLSSLRWRLEDHELNHSPSLIGYLHSVTTLLDQMQKDMNEVRESCQAVRTIWNEIDHLEEFTAGETHE